MIGNLKILMVVINGYIMENGEFVGIWFMEFFEVYLEFKKEGYEVVVVSLKGGILFVDFNSLIDDVMDEDKEVGKFLENIKLLVDISL